MRISNTAWKILKICLLMHEKRRLFYKLLLNEEWQEFLNSGLEISKANFL
jgi:hypothetical protein